MTYLNAGAEAIKPWPVLKPVQSLPQRDITILLLREKARKEKRLISKVRQEIKGRK